MTGVFHAFPGSAAEARKVTAIGFMIGIGGVVTFRNGRQGEAAIEAGINNILLETDAPYLAPVPHRGKRNESSYLTLVIDKLSEVLAITPAEVADRSVITSYSIHYTKLYEIFIDGTCQSYPGIRTDI